jgi:AraC-like DNA-binding protein
MTDVIRGAALAGYFQTAHQMGLDTAPLLRAAGLSRPMLVNTEQLLPVQAVMALLEASAKASGVATFGLQMAAGRSLADMGMVSLLIAHQATLRDALGILGRYRNWINSTLVLQIETIDDVVILREDFSLGSGATSKQSTDLAMGVLMRICTAVLGPQWQPASASFTCPAPSAHDREVYYRLFRCRVDFGGEFDGIVISESDLDLPNPHADAALALHARNLLETIMEPSALTTMQEVEQSILLLLPSGRASIKASADALGLNVRTLQRHLDAAGVTYSGLLNSVRSQQAHRHLANPKLRMTDIADLVGYRSQGSFTRWFSHEFGKAPSRLRRRAM